MDLKKTLNHLRNIGWTVKIIPKLQKEISVLHFNALDALRLSFVGSLVFLIVFGYFIVKGSKERAAVRILSKSLQLRDDQLRQVEKQKVEVENLLAQKAGKLEQHLSEMKHQEEEIRKLLLGKRRYGAVNAKQVAMRSPEDFQKSRFARKSSRSGNYNQLVERLSSLERQIAHEKFNLGQVKKMALLREQQLEEERQKLLSGFDSVPSLWPADGTITSSFGYRIHPIAGEGEFHPGLDIATGYASPIRATASGRCVYASYKSGFGLTILIDHGNGLITQYSHCSRIFTQEGSFLKKGEMIALVGSTGYSTGPHIHYGVLYHNTPINPSEFLGLTVDKLADLGGIGGLVSSRN